MTTKTELVWKRCPCEDSKWAKCPHPWYLQKFRHKGKAYEPNLTRWAELNLPADQQITTKTQAEHVAELVRTQIRSGAYVPAKVTNALPPAEAPGQTLAQLADRYDAAVITPDPESGENTKDAHRARLRALCAFTPADARKPLGEWLAADVTLAAIVAFRTSPRITRASRSLWAKYRTATTGLFAWATAEQAIPVNPFTHSPRAEHVKALRRVRRAEREDRRTRRIQPDEEQRLYAACDRAGAANGGKFALVFARMALLIFAAIETGMRLGELLALQWGDVHFAARRIAVRAIEAGAGKTGVRIVPLSKRLAAALQAVALDAAGKPWPMHAYVFGDAVGGKISQPRKAWHTVILMAHGHTPVVTPRQNLSPASRGQLKAIGLHFHDLRHEAGCRWLESKQFDLEQIRQIYGHTSIAQTAEYLHASSDGMFAAMAAYDRLQERQAREQAQAAEVGGSVHNASTNPNGASANPAGLRLVDRANSPTD